MYIFEIYYVKIKNISKENEAMTIKNVDAMDAVIKQFL